MISKFKDIERFIRRDNLRGLLWMKYNSLFRDYYNYLLEKGLISEERYLKALYFKRTGKKLNLSNPITFNEKLQWLKVYYRNPLAYICADKYRVRDYIKEKIGEEILNELIDVYDSPKEIDVNRLPDNFVLKTSHGNGNTLICRDKKKVNWKKKLNNFSKLLKTNYYLALQLEWPYKNNHPRIICEKFLEDNETNDLMDYKMFCFSGNPAVIQVDFDRFTNHKRNIYDIDWNFMDKEIRYPSDPKKKIKKPEYLSEMIEISKILSHDFPHVRVDLYLVNKKIYFGELTFFHGSGYEEFRPESFNKQMGDLLILPAKNRQPEKS